MNGVAFSPDGQFLASASSDRSVKVWRVADGSLVRTFGDFYETVTSVAFSHNGQRLVAGSIDRTVKVWNVADWSLIRDISTGDFVLGVAFSPNDAQLAASGGYSGNWIHLYRTSDWEETALLGIGQQQNVSIAYSPNGAYLAWAIDARGVRLEQVATGSFCLLSEPSTYGYFVNSVAFSPNGQTLAGGSDSKSIAVWRVADCVQLLSLNGPSGAVKSVGYSPDGRMILAGGQDYGASRGTLLFWNATNGALRRVCLGETSTAVRAVRYSPDGNLFAYGRDDGAVVMARNPFPGPLNTR